MIQEWFKNLKEILKTDKYIFTNLLIRIVLVCIAIIFHHWQDGDTNHYLMASNSVCHGEWGGEPGRVPFYYWFVALTSFCRVYRFGINSWGGGVESTLIVQTFLVFFVGIFIYKKFNKKLSYLWLFDPVILIYSNLIMSDLFFAIAVFGMTYFFYLELTQPKTNSKSLIYFSIFSGVTLLSRPIGIPLIYVSLLILIIFALKKIFSFKKILICASIILALITPRLLWNLKYHNSLFLAAQGGEWSKTIVAAVEYHHEGISFTDPSV